MRVLIGGTISETGVCQHPDAQNKHSLPFLPMSLCIFYSFCQEFWNLCPNATLSERSSLAPSHSIMYCAVCYLLIPWKSKITWISYFFCITVDTYFSMCVKSSLEHKPYKIRACSLLVGSVSPRPCRVFGTHTR